MAAVHSRVESNECTRFCIAWMTAAADALPCMVHSSLHSDQAKDAGMIPVAQNHALELAQ